MNSVNLRALSAAARDSVLCQAREAQTLEILIMELGDIFVKNVDMGGVTEFTTSTLVCPSDL
jgi:hypothetical protein